MDNFSIEVVVFGILILVILSDFFIKGFKKKKDIKDDSNLIENKKSADPKKTKKLLYFLQYLKERPRNVSLYIFLVLLMKGLISFSINERSGYHIYNGKKKIFFSSTSKDIKEDMINSILFDNNFKEFDERMKKYYDGVYYFISPITFQNYSCKACLETYPGKFSPAEYFTFDSIMDHYTYILRFSYLSFLYAFILTGFLTWQLNPYIKKR